MPGKSYTRSVLFDFLMLSLVLSLAFWVAFIPHQNYQFPVHGDEWTHLTYSEAIMRSGGATFAEPFGGQWTMSTASDPEIGFHLLWGIFQQVTGISWLTIFRYFPGIIFMITVLAVYILARKQGFGWEAALFTCLIPTSVGILGPAFLVPVALGLLFIPLALFLAFNIKTYQSFILISIFASFLLSLHAPSAIVLALVLIPYILLNLKGSFRYSLGLLMALAVPFGVILLFMFKALLPTAQLLSAPQLPNPFVRLPSIVETYGYIPIVFGFVGTVLLMARTAKESLGLGLSALSLLLPLFIFYRLHYGLSIVYERGLIHFLLILGIIAGAGLQWVRRIRLLVRSADRRRTFLFRNQGSILCLLLVSLTLAISIPVRLNTYYYHMIEREDYQAFAWIRDNVGVDYKLALLDPWKGTAFTAITGRNVVRRLFISEEPIDQEIYRFFRDGCEDAKFLGDNEVSLVYNQSGCSNPNLSEVREDVYVTNPKLFLSPKSLSHNGNFEAIYGNPPAWWYRWSEDSTPFFLYPEPGRGGGSSVGIKILETNPFKPWPKAMWLQDMPVEVGKSYRVRGWIKTENVVGAGGAMIVPSWKSPEKVWIGNTAIMGYIRGTQDWTYYEGEVIAPSNAPTVTLSLLLEGSSGTAWFDEVVFEAH